MSCQPNSTSHPSRGGQYKYSIHTIIFSQDISNIATFLPRLISDLDILVVNKCNHTKKPYGFFVSRTHVLASLEYKMSNDPYDKNVRVNPITSSSLSLESTYISPLLLRVNPHDTPFYEHNSPSIVQLPNSLEPHELQSSSFISTRANSRTEVEEIRRFLHIPYGPLPPSINYPPIGISPINEYNTEGLLSKSFPILFPTGVSMIK